MKSVHSKLGARLDQATEEERRVIKLMLQMFATGHIVSWSHRHAMEEARRRGLPPAVDEQPTLGCVNVANASRCIMLLSRTQKDLRDLRLLPGKEVGALRILLEPDAWSNPLTDTEEALNGLNFTLHRGADSDPNAHERLRAARQVSQSLSETRLRINKLRGMLHLLPTGTGPFEMAVKI